MQARDSLQRLAGCYRPSTAGGDRHHSDGLSCVARAGRNDVALLNRIAPVLRTTVWRSPMKRHRLPGGGAHEMRAIAQRPRKIERTMPIATA